MNPKLAKKRYLRVIIPSMVLFLGSLFMATWILKGTEIPLVFQVILSLIPAACMCWYIWGYGRYLLEIDEYQRSVDIRAILTGLGVTLAFCTTWGLLEMLVDAPKFPVYYTVVVFCVAYGISKSIISKRIVCV